MSHDKPYTEPAHPSGESACDGKDGFFTAYHVGHQWVCTDQNCSWRRTHLGGLNRDVSAGASHAKPDGSAAKPAEVIGAQQGAAPILTAVGTAVAQVRGAYEPLTREMIEEWREHWNNAPRYNEDSVGAHSDEMSELNKLCDMAINSLLYGEEIHRLRDKHPQSAVPDRMTSPAAEHLANQLDQEADEITCYASTIKEYRPNKSAALLREASKVIRLNVLYPDRTQIGWQCTEASGARHFIWKAEDEDAELAWIKKRYISWVPAFIAIAPTVGATSK